MDWIKLEERIPEEGTQCLVVTEFGIEIDEYSEIYENPLPFSSASVCVGVGFQNNDFEDITHWMPLPKLPES